jgi:hypothetical protein
LKDAGSVSASGEQSLPGETKVDRELVDLLGAAWKAAKRDERGLARLTGVGERAGNRSSFDVRNYGFSRLAEMVESLPNFVTERRRRSHVDQAASLIEARGPGSRRGDPVRRVPDSSKLFQPFCCGVQFGPIVSDPLDKLARLLRAYPMLLRKITDLVRFIARDARTILAADKALVVCHDSNSLT